MFLYGSCVKKQFNLNSVVDAVVTLYFQGSNGTMYTIGQSS